MDFFKHLTSPERIAVMCERPCIPGIETTLISNLINSGFRGTVYPVTRDAESVYAVPAYPSLKDLPAPPDVVLITSCDKDTPKTVQEAGKAGAKTAIIYAPDFMNRIKNGTRIMERIRSSASRHKIRCLGPNSLGIMHPSFNLNMSLSYNMPPAGRIAFISQSATFASTILDYAAAKHVGFSLFLSLGLQADLDIADLIDGLGTHGETRGIILYVEHIKDGRKFLSAARSFARTKPMVIVKGGRFEESAMLSYTRLGSMAGEDLIYDAVFRRAGMVRVEDMLELFNTSESLSKLPTPAGKRLAIVTNAGGPAILAIDTLIKSGGQLAELSPETRQEISDILGVNATVTNPVDCLSNVSADQFSQVVRACMEDEENDAVLAILTSQFSTQPFETAHKVVEVARDYWNKPLFACWMGSRNVDKGRELLNINGIATYVTPEQAVKSFIYMVNHRENIRLLSETPSRLLEDFVPDIDRAKAVLEAAAKDGRTMLTETEAKEIFAAYGLSSPESILAHTPQEALEAARKLGFPVALKVESPDAPLKSEVRGVYLHIYEDQLELTFNKIRKNLERYRPGARFNGISVQKMILMPGFEFAIGTRKDPTFGAVIVFGLGGRLAQAEKDVAVGLPPLNQTLARRLMESTKVYRFLQENNFLDLDLDILEEVLVRFSILVTDFPQIKEMDINPFLLAPHRLGTCLDGRIVMEDDALQGIQIFRGPCCPTHLSICPYPQEYTEHRRLKGLEVTFRAIVPEDEPLMRELFYSLSEQSIIQRFFQLKADISHEELVNYCQVDYDREIAIVAEIEQDGKRRIIGVGRITSMGDRSQAELAVTVGDPWQGRGLGTALMEKIIEIARNQGIKRLWMHILRDNEAMLRLAKKFRFKEGESEDRDIVSVYLNLTRRGKKRVKECD